MDFEDEEYPNHIYKLHKTLYGFKQAPKVWYECLRDFLIENSVKIGKTDFTLFTRKCLKKCRWWPPGGAFWQVQ
jgi:hypothetical protein